MAQRKRPEAVFAIHVGGAEDVFKDAANWFPVDVELPSGKGWQRIMARLGRAPDGRLACTGLLVGDEHHEVTARGLRRIPIAQLIAQFTSAYNVPNVSNVPLWPKFKEELK